MQLFRKPRMSDDDIQLDRRFLELKSGEEDDVARDLPLFDLRDIVPWDRVLEERCAVILGEAGTGKTTEFRLRRKLLAESGRPAFFLAVEELATKQVTALLDSDEEQHFSAWGSAETIAYFFLDAVDEARLRNAKSLPSALRNLERDLRGKLARSRVLISCRVSDWRAQSDRREIQSILLKGDVKQEVKVFALAPLVEAQVVLLAKHYRVGDVDAFIRETRWAGAYSYLERPGDVAWLVGHWREQGTIGTYTQLIASNVDRKLRETNPDRRPSLSPAKAKLAATALAGLGTLQRKASFVIPDGELDPERAATSLDSNEVLPDLTPGEIAELLTLPLFDEATYGRVRIHHRSVSEYLTARWLWSLMQQGLDPSEVERLLFQQTPSGPALPPDLTQAAAWLAAESPFIRDRVMAIAPLALLEGGDPNALPDDIKRTVLNRLAEQYEGRQWLFRSFDRVTLRRLATSSIAQTINELLAASDRPVELLETLLRIVIEGNMEGCASAVTAIAVDSARPAPVRADAIEAVARVGAPADKEAAVHALLGEQDIDPQIGGAAVDHLFPMPLDVARLLELLRRSAKPPSDKTTWLERVLSSRVYERTPAADRARLLSGILDLVQDPAAGEARRWLLAPFARVVVAHASTCDDEVGRRSLRFLDEVARGLTFETRHDLSRVSDELRALLRAQPELRRFLFWEQAAQPAPNGRGRPTRHHAIFPGRAPLWRVSAADLDWLERDALSRDHIADKLLAFDSFLSVQVPGERAEEVRARTERLAASHPALKTRFERRAKGSGYVHPMEARWAREQQVLENRQHRDHAANVAWFREHLEEIRSGESLDALIWLWHRVPSWDEEKIEVVVRELTDQLGAEIAQAAEEGWRRSWRTVECPLPHEKEERNIVSNTATIGLAGISADLRHGLDLASLSADAATQAARLATHAMNRFPPWIEPLVRHHGPCVQAVFGTCIRADYAAPAQHDVLGLLAYAPQPVQEICAPVLGELIQAGDPVDTRVLEQVLAALLSLPAWRTVLAQVAPERCAGDTSDLARFALWWAVWFAADPDAAVESLATQIAADGDRAGDRVLVVCERIHLWLERDQQAGFGLPEHARALTSFLAIVLTYVHPSDDVLQVGAHFLGARDHAERLRGQLIQRLAAIPGPETVDGLVQLANDPRWPEWHDWLLSLAERRRADDLTVPANDVAAKLLKAYQTHGLAAPEHLVEAGLLTVSMTAGPPDASAGPPRTPAGAAAATPGAITGRHTLRILHISDLHLRGPREPDRARRARVLGPPWLGNVTELRGDGRFDLVAFTGDVAFSGQLDEYLELMVRPRSDGTVVRWIDETLTAAGCGRDDLYVVPGNHDIARDIHTPAWRTIREEWDRATGPGDDDAFARWLVRGRPAPRGMDAGLRERLLERTTAYRAWIAHGLGRPDLLPTPSRSQLGYRVTRRFAHLPFPVHIIGLDSAWLAGDDHDARKLRLTDEQILHLCTGDDGEHLKGLRIALVHHPLADLADSERARRLLQEHGVDVLLSGHLHDPEAREIATPDGHLLDLAAGCLYQHDRYRNGVTAMTLDLDDTGRVHRIEFRFRSWSDRGHWHDDDSLYRGSRGGRLVWPAR